MTSSLLIAWLVAPEQAAAIPAFARRYEQSCGTCHRGSFPELNAFGRAFKENGYQMPEGAEDPYRARRMVEPGTSIEPLAVFKEPPLSVRLQTNVAYRKKSVPIAAPPYTTRRGELDFNLPSDLMLVGGGPLLKNVAAFFSVGLFPALDLHHATLAFTDILPGDVVNVRAGRFMLLDWVNPTHRQLAISGDLATSVVVGQNQFFLDSHQTGFDVWGRPGAGPLFWQLAVVNGGAGMVADTDRFKDVYARLAATFLENQTFGVIGYRGQSRVEDRRVGAVRRFDDNFFLAGADLELNVGPSTSFAQLVVGRHENPFGDGRGVLYHGLSVRMTFDITSRIIALGAYQTVGSRDDPMLEQTHVVSHLQYLLALNLRAGLEYRLNVTFPGRSAVWAFAEAAF